MSVGIDAALATFVDVNQRRVSSPAAFNVIIQRVVSQVGLRADVPFEGGRIPLQHLVPLTEPRQLVRRPSPKTFRILLSLFDPLLHHRTNQVVRNRMSGVLVDGRRSHVRRFGYFRCSTHRKTPFQLMARSNYPQKSTFQQKWPDCFSRPATASCMRWYLGAFGQEF